MITPALIEKARLHVRRHFARNIPGWMVFHDLEHTLSVVRAAQHIGRSSGLSESSLRTVEVAALFHDAGYAEAYHGHEKKSAALARGFLADNDVPRSVIEQVRGLIMATRVGERPRSLMQRVLRDADSCKSGQVDFEEKSERLRRELEHVRGERIRPDAWLAENLAYLRGHRFFTPYAERRFGRQRSINLRRLEQRARLPKKDQRTKNTPGKERFFDRDLSWLAFNARVLQEAQDERTPLLERLKFLAIHSSNLDEFYRVRVAQLRGLRNLAKRDRSALDVPPEKRIALINAQALEQQQAFGRIYRERLLPALARHGVRFLDTTRLSAAQRMFAERYFIDHVAPLLQTAALRAANAPFIEDRKLYLVFSLQRKGTRKERRVLVNVPSDELGRFITLPAHKGRTELLFLDDAIRLCAPTFFSGFKVRACHAIKLSRDAELYLDEEFAETVVDKVRRSLRKRRTGMPSRFLYDGEMPRPMLRELREVLGVKKQDLIRGGRYHNFSDLMSLPVKGHDDLRERPLAPLPHPALGMEQDVFAAIAARDQLIHFPYHDFRSITDLLRRSARDPRVSSIAITLYRVARGSLVCEALLEAARSGKRVTVFVEVQARFDEGNNLFWGEALEQAGARVIYSREGLKVHCKLCLIERREGRKRTVRYAYLGTGNFNERTAQVYCDMGLLTCDEGLVSDVMKVFDHLRDKRVRLDTKHLMVAPTNLRSGLERLIDQEITNALSGRAAMITLKLNSLEDHPLIRKLYDAHRAGVHVRLIVRGICCLVTGIEGMSEGITAISIVDRFLEHARAYVFHNNGKPLVFLSSADLMERNMDRRVETAFPILDRRLREEVLRYIDLQWSDVAKARAIDAEQRNMYRDAKWSRPGALRSQTAWYEQLRRSGTAKKTPGTRRKATRA